MNGLTFSFNLPHISVHETIRIQKMLVNKYSYIIVYLFIIKSTIHVIYTYIYISILHSTYKFSQININPNFRLAYNTLCDSARQSK